MSSTISTAGAHWPIRETTCVWDLALSCTQVHAMLVDSRATASCPRYTRKIVILSRIACCPSRLSKKYHYFRISEVIVAGGTPSEPDATWNVTLERTSFTDYGVLGLPLAGVYGIFPWPVSPPQCRCRLSCILLKMPAISLLTGRQGLQIQPRGLGFRSDGCVLSWVGFILGFDAFRLLAQWPGRRADRTVPVGTKWMF